MGPRPSVQEARDRGRERILQAFEERAAQHGPRGVVMAELARDLGISTRTLYQHFGSKAEIVREIMERWARELEAEQKTRERSGLAPKERMMQAAEAWIDRQDRFSEAFWDQVYDDFPDASQILARQIQRSQAVAREYLAPRIHADFDVDLALSLMRSSIGQALDRKHCDRLGVSRQQAVRQAIELWCRGALAPAAVPSPAGASVVE